MSTASMPGPLSANPNRKVATEESVFDAVMPAVRALASLKLTIVLFSLAMVIVFVGSLAQSRRDVWLVMAQYFRTYLAWIDIADLFPPSMFPQLANYDWNNLGKIRYLPFPGGWLIGWVMLANLTAAHMLKFSIRATGARLNGGIAVVAIGVLLTWLVIFTGDAQMGVESGNFALSPDQIWYTLLGVLAVSAGVCFATAFSLMGKSSNSKSARWIMGITGLALSAVLCYFVAGGEDAQLNVSSMRILWQLLKGSACSLVLLIGCNLLFEKRGGIVLLHVGVALLMFSELQVGLYGKENLLSLKEGETTSFLRDIRERELAIAHRLEDGKDSFIVVPEALLITAANQEQPADQIIPLPDAPFNIAVRRFYRNSTLRPTMPDDELRTSNGLGAFAAPVELDPVTGMDSTSDESAAYVDVLDKDTGNVISSILLAQNVSELRSVPIAEEVNVDGTDYRFYLRFQRNHRPYEVELLDVSRTNYVGSATPRDYRSSIVIRDSATGASENFTLWMNNPLRYQGETFYQSGYNKLSDGSEATTLSVVRNKGWMLPYIACMIVSFGMFAQFWQTLVRYLGRKERTGPASSPVVAGEGTWASGGTEKSTIDIASSAVATPRPSVRIDADQPMPSAEIYGASHTGSGLSEPAADPVFMIGVPLLAVLLFAAWLGKDARPPRDVDGAMNLYKFAQLPIAWNGRAQPIDSFARTQLLITSHKSSFKGELDPGELADDRADLLKAFTRFWPDVKSDSLNDFNGTYEEWVDEMANLTSSSREAVEERMRPLMIRKMEPVRWFLDVVARPEVAQRHRIIKIDDDQVLSLLGLPKRAGLTYSMLEVQKNLDALQSINMEAAKLRRQGQDNQLSTLQRRVGALFETVSRIDSMRNMFLTRDSDNMLSSLVDSWRILRILGDQPAVMSVPTGNENEQRSWETMVASNALLQLSTRMSDANLQSADDLVNYINDVLPREIVATALNGTYKILDSAVKMEADGQAAENAIQQRAASAIGAMNDQFLKGILSIIAAASPGTTPQEMLVAMTPEQMRNMASDRISSDLFEVFSTSNAADEKDPRLLAIRQRLQKVGVDDESALAKAMSEELARLAFADVQERAGHLLPGGENAETFRGNAASMARVLEAWASGNVDAFNNGIQEYQALLQTEHLPHVDPVVVNAETWFNYYEPFYKAICLYLPVLVLSFLGWMFWGPVLRRTSMWLLVLAFVLHSGALLMRMWISGRPPVTNLYSSAIFIGWAVVIAAFVIELLLKNGIGNILGATVGAATLTIAHYLARDEGDTLGVMQAVLDTTFWLATHVVCITLGYAATFLAGGIGIVYTLMALFSRRTDKDVSLKSIGQLVYGVLCFALFFSLVGTVLGGLWADDSWGRFWGWDPKENGAMLIVLWNALILHARWDKLVRDYGTAVLAIAGNIVTAWSWFGVNELKAGLHTYGFTEGRLFALAVFIGVQFAIMLLAMIAVQFHRKAGVNVT